MVNVGTGNMLLQEDDMAVAHKGVEFAFRRTYNSQSKHDVNNSDGSIVGNFGNGWTNTFDAHLAPSTGGVSVYDIDGARYDYSCIGVSCVPPAGQHATLTSDGGCGWYWTKKTGTVYYFYSLNVTACGENAAYNGRIYQIIGRNHNTFLTFAYTWTGTGATAQPTQIVATTESGLSATLTFSSVSGHQLLTQLLRPDATVITYSYDSVGNLSSAARPAPNVTPGATATEGYGSTSLAGSYVMSWAASPRWVVDAGQCTSALTDCGGYLAFFYTAGNSIANSTLNSIAHFGYVDLTVPDGVSTGPMQALPANGSGTGAYPSLGEFFNLSPVGTANTPTYRDTDNHYTNWVIDGSGRPTQTQECASTTGSPPNGMSCSAALLITNELWDNNNNLISSIEPRGYETDYSYDSNGNTVAVAKPSTTVQTGATQAVFRPTKLFSYDGFNNVVAACDEIWSHANGHDWNVTGNPGSADSLCPITVGSPSLPAATTAIYQTQSYEPFGEQTSLATPMGYHKAFTYSSASQQGTDFGLVTDAVGDSFVEADGSNFQAQEHFVYDTQGNVGSYSNGTGTWTFVYDSMNRRIKTTDPDGVSSYDYFDLDGSTRMTETATQHASGSGVVYAYDSDGNESSETHHYNNTAGTTSKWYDGDDRLVEVELPHDSTDAYTYSWLTRYLYDLSQGQFVSFGGANIVAHGGLYDTQEYVAPVSVCVWQALQQGCGATPSWMDQKGAAFDALDRAVAKYSYPSGSATLQATGNTYDATSNSVGLLSSTSDPLNENSQYTYNELGLNSGVTFTGDGGVTPARTTSYDADARTANVTSSVYGTHARSYDQDGRLINVAEAAGAGLTSPATYSYSYYPNGLEKGVGVASTTLNASPLKTYNYRSDGEKSSLVVKYNGITSSFAWTYTIGGRELTQSDPYSGTTAGGITMVSRTSTYDGYGQLASLLLPGTPNYRSIAHDAEGETMNYSSTLPASVGPQQGTATATYAYTVRGESLSETQTVPNPSGPTPIVYLNASANGAAVRQGYLSSTTPTQNVDGRNAMILSSTTHAVMGQVAVTYVLASNFDNANRMTSRTSSQSAIITLNGTETLTTAFDAENHSIGMTYAVTGNPPGTWQNYGYPGSAQFGWGPNGHPIILTASNAGAATYHYDGDQLLFVTGGNGLVTGVNIDMVGVLNSSGHMNVLDRDYAQMAVSSHDASGYGTWGFTTGGSYQAASRKALTQTSQSVTVPASSGTYDWYDLTEASATLLPFYIHPDGFGSPMGTIQGVRASNDQGVFTTPDAYAGDVHDPMSQKPFMWNRNNPYTYSDPSGYAPCIGSLCVPTPVVGGAAVVVRAVVAAVGGAAATTTAGIGVVAAGLVLATTTPAGESPEMLRSLAAKEGAQDKKLTPQQVKNLEANTGEDVHDIKDETSGTSKGNLYLTPSGTIVHKATDSGPGNDTGHTREDTRTPQKQKP